MERTIRTPVLYISLIICSQFYFDVTTGVQLKLRHDVEMMPGSQTTCGIVHCSEEVDLAEAGNITSLAMFKRVDGPGDRRRVTVAYVSQARPRVSRLWNSIKTDAVWAPQKAEATLYLVELDDCRLAEFVCQVNFIDGMGKERVSVSTVGRPGVDTVFHTDITNTPSVVRKETPKVLRDSLAADAALQLSVIIQQSQTSLSGSLQHLQDRIEDKMDSIDKTLTNLENRDRGGCQCRESAVLDSPSGNVVESLKQLTEGVDYLTTSLGGALKTRNCSIENVHNTLLVSYLNDKVEKLINQSNIKANRLESILKAFFNDTVELKQGRAESGTNLTQPTKCSRQDGPSLDEVPGEILINHGENKKPYWCDLDGGWTVIQRRRTGSVDFYRDWAAYKRGFGSLKSDFWLGNDKIHELTSSGPHELMVKLEYNGKSAYAHYDRFYVASEDDNYKLELGLYQGTAGDALTRHNGMNFSTFDRDNDISTQHCARMYKGAWWYEKCHSSNLNGVWGASGNKGPRWSGLSGEHAVSTCEMRIRPKYIKKD